MSAKLILINNHHSTKGKPKNSRTSRIKQSDIQLVAQNLELVQRQLLQLSDAARAGEVEPGPLCARGLIDSAVNWGIEHGFVRGESGWRVKTGGWFMPAIVSVLVSY